MELLGGDAEFFFEGAEEVGVIDKTTFEIYVKNRDVLLDELLGKDEAFFEDKLVR